MEVQQPQWGEEKSLCINGKSLQGMDLNGTNKGMEIQAISIFHSQDSENTSSD